MTGFDDLGRLDTRIVNALDGIAPVRQLDYLDDVLWQTSHSSQRPRWSFMSTWLPADRLAGSIVLPFRVRWVQLLALLLLGALVLAGVAALVGSFNPRPAPPFGLAANGAIAYSSEGDLYVREELGEAGRLLAGGDGDQFAPVYSPDGLWLAYSTTLPDGDHFMVMDARGGEARELAILPATGDAWFAWSPDSRSMALIYDVKSIPTLRIAHLDGSPDTVVDLGDARPLEVAWRPPDGSQLLVRVVTGHVAALNRPVDFLLIDAKGNVIHEFDLPSPQHIGWTWDNSGIAWSPDGSTIAYNRVNPGSDISAGQFRVHLIDPDGTNDRAVPGPTDPDVQENWPIFSPDGSWLLVHRWTWKTNNGGQGWLAVMPGDGSAPARNIGPRIAGGEDTGLVKAWSPDATRVLLRAANTRQVFSIEPASGDVETLPWTTELPDWQRKAP